MELEYIVCDTEANGLLDTATIIWCMCAIDNEGNRFEAVGEQQIRELVKIANTYPRSVWHNGVGFDNPLLEKLYGIKLHNVFDTLIASQITNPDRKGGHGIASWGEELGVAKPEHEEWDRFSEAMLHRCKEDVVIGKKVYEALLKKMEGWDWDSAMRLEQKVAEWHQVQVRNGVLFDMQKAEALCTHLRSNIETASKEIEPDLPYVCKKGGTVESVFKKDGTHKHYVEDYWGFDVEQVVGAYSRVEFHKVDLGSDNQVKNWFLSIGWQPTEYTDKGSPKLTEDSFDSLPAGNPATRLATMRVEAHRLAQITGLMGNVREDGRIASEAFTCGSVTGRYKHRVIANLPRVTSPYGLEMRALFCVPEGKLMLGSDLSQIEARVMGHYLFPYDGGESVRELLEGDVHQKLADFAGVSRDTAKTIRYAIMYGCAASNLGKKVGVSQKEGKRLHKAFWDANIPLKKLTDDLGKAYKRRGFIKGLDGRKLMIRSEHSLLNSLLQAGATVIFKTGLCIMNKKLTEFDASACLKYSALSGDILKKAMRKKGVDYKQLIAYHDEVQLEINKEDEDVVRQIVLDSWKEAGKYWDMRVEIVGDVKVGVDWASTH